MCFGTEIIEINKEYMILNKMVAFTFSLIFIKR